MTTHPQAYFDVAEARRAAEIVAVRAGVTDPERLERIKSAAGRTVASSGSVSLTRINELVQSGA